MTLIVREKHTWWSHQTPLLVGTWSAQGQVSAGSLIHEAMVDSRAHNGASSQDSH